MTKEKKNKCKWIHIRCSEEEYSSLHKKSERFKTLSSYLRELIFSSKKVIIEPSSFLEGMGKLADEVNHVGKNINQLARYVNYAEKAGLPGDDNALMEVREYLSLYINTLSKIEDKFNNILSKT